MRARRDLMRAVVPPLLALGLVALLTRPVDAAAPRIQPTTTGTTTTQTVPAPHR